MEAKVIQYSVSTLITRIFRSTYMTYTCPKQLCAATEHLRCDQGKKIHCKMHAKKQRI